MQVFFYNNSSLGPVCRLNNYNTLTFKSSKSAGSNPPSIKRSNIHVYRKKNVPCARAIKSLDGWSFRNQEGGYYHDSVERVKKKKKKKSSGRTAVFFWRVSRVRVCVRARCGLAAHEGPQCRANSK